jgi:hypothetical protein
MKRFEVLSLALLAVFTAPRAGAQEISNLEGGRPVTVEDAAPIEHGRLSGSFDYAYARRLDGVEYAGPGLSLDYGVLRGFELGAETRYLTNPRLNARRGIGSGDLDVHALASVLAEDARRPGIAVRVDGFLPTGFASHGADFSGTLLATRSFDEFRLHANVGSLYVGDRRPGARRNRLFAAAGIDTAPHGAWDTTTMGVADLVVRQSVLTDGKVSMGIEIGVKRRVGIQTIFFAGLGTEILGERDRARYRGLLGFSHAF